MLARMNVLHLAVGLTIAGGTCLVAGAALYDPRLGLLVLGTLCIAVGFLLDESGRRR
jgi:hypothetical protein